jgi:hypothetical protein
VLGPSAGTSDIMKVIVAQALIKSYGKRV